MSERGMNMSCHVPVLRAEIVAFLKASEGGSFLDCTLGGGGHTAALLEASSQNTVAAFDRDTAAVEQGRRRFAAESRVRIFHADFEKFAAELEGQKFNGVLADLGFSSDQLAAGRGFSFEDRAPLDMRMDQTQELTAGELVNRLSESDLRRLFRRGGAEKEAGAAARAIVKARPIGTAEELSRLMEGSLRTERSKSKGEKRSHPATVIFQALRIAVNREIEQLEALLESVPNFAAPGARLAIISFHSLEDKIVARKMREWSAPSFSAHWPGSESGAVLGKLLTRKAVLPTEAEVAANPRARSARLRVFEFRGHQ